MLDGLRCYRLTHRSLYDEEVIGQYVERSGGDISIRQDCTDYWVDARAELFLNCAWPELERRPELDRL